MARRLVVEADGGSRGNPGPAAYGAVVRDADTGEVLAERAEAIGTATNNVAEYRGLIAGLQAVRELSPDAEVEARLDSKLVVEQMSGRWRIKHPALQPLALEAQRALPRSQVSYTWVPRELNKHADRLLNEVLDGRPAGVEASTPTPAQPELDEAEVEPAAPNVLRGWSADSGVPTTFLLLRHGETPYTLEKRFSGRGGADVGLTDAGRAQAERAATALAARGGIDAIVASPLRRTVETAEAVAAATGLSVRTEDGFAECAFGEWDGLTFDEVRERWPDELARWLQSPSERPPGGESFEEHEARVRRARDVTMARNPRRTVVVVTHVTPVKQLVRLALGAPAPALFRMELAPASLTAVQWWADGGSSLRLFNGTEHLGAVPPAHGR